MFIERKAEETALNEFLNDASQSIACVYGRKGMGKTTLLKHFAKAKSGIYISAYATTDREEEKLFARSLGMDGAETGNISMKRILNEEIPRRAQTGDALVLVIDNYPDFVKADPSYEELLFSCVTSEWKSGRVKLILCGDSFLAMDKLVTGKKAIWRQTKKAVIQVDAMPFSEAAAFLDGATPEEKLFLYGITGGIPYQLAKLPKKDETDNIIRAAIRETFLQSTRGGRLLPADTMGIELREPAYYNRMLTTLAKDLQRVNQISAEVGKPKDIVVPYLNSLMALGMVTKETAVTEKNNRKKTRYSIVNTGDLFWFRFIAQNMYLYANDEFDALTDEILSNTDAYLHDVFTRLCKEYLIAKAGSDALPVAIDEIGNWWVNDDEKGTTEGFDLVALGSREGNPATIYGRCYHSEKPIEISQLKNLIDLARRVDREGDVFYIIFSSGGFHENAETVAATIKNIMLVTLEDVVAM